jgi:hypothetical protein
MRLVVWKRKWKIFILKVREYELLPPFLINAQHFYWWSLRGQQRKPDMITKTLSKNKNT